MSRAASLHWYCTPVWAIVGVAAALFVRGLHWTEDLFDRIPGSYFRHAVGMLLIGVMIYLLLVFAGHYYVEGVGYATIQATLAGQLSGAGFLILLFACKLLATNISLGRLVGRDFLTIAVYGRDARRRVRRVVAGRAARYRDQPSGICDGRHGGNGRRWHRRCDDGRDDDF